MNAADDKDLYYLIDKYKLQGLLYRAYDEKRYFIFQSYYHNNPKRINAIYICFLYKGLKIKLFNLNK